MLWRRDGEQLASAHVVPAPLRKLLAVVARSFAEPMRVFISTPDPDEQSCAAFINALSGAGCSVLTSPKAVASNFSDWYSGGCHSLLARMDVFVAIVSNAWASSTWMAVEADAALACAAHVPLCCVAWNPRALAVPNGLKPYAANFLPASLPDAVRCVVSNVSPSHPTVVDKVLTYIVARDRILVLTQPGSEDAGRQVPGGSVEPGETLQRAALREAEEETGLTQFSDVRYVGSSFYVSRNWPDRIFHRHFFRLAHPETATTSWRHIEATPSTGVAPISLELSWVPLQDVQLDWQMDAYLSDVVYQPTPPCAR